MVEAPRELVLPLGIRACLSSPCPCRISLLVQSRLL